MKVRRDSRTARLMDAIKDMDGLQSRVGWFEGNNYPDGTPVAYVATIQEFGSESTGTPPRPFMRTTITERSGAWREQMAKAAKAVTDGKITAFQAMEQIGLTAEGDIRKTLSTLTEPPLSKVTLMLRKMKAEGKTITYSSRWEAIRRLNAGEGVDGVSTKPLNDSGLMLATLTSQTTKDKE